MVKGLERVAPRAMPALGETAFFVVGMIEDSRDDASPTPGSPAAGRDRWGEGPRRPFASSTRLPDQDA